jgi:probable rRNA maturation factor
MSELEIVNKTKSELGRSLLNDIKNKVLGEDYELSLALVPASEIADHNKERRGVDSPTDVLSFSLSEKSGEIIISPEVAREKAPDFGMDAEKYLPYLFIHACLHLRGLDHGSIMESEESKFGKFFGL